MDDNCSFVAELVEGRDLHGTTTRAELHFMLWFYYDYIDVRTLYTLPSPFGGRSFRSGGPGPTVQPSHFLAFI